MTINERVSDERLNTIKSWREAYGQDANVMIPASEAEAIISELQQYRAAAEPVAFTEAHEISNMHATGLYLRAWPADRERNEAEGYTIPLYAAPQVTSVPEEVPESLKDRLLTICDLVEDNDEYCQDIWNACRAAILNGGKS